MSCKLIYISSHNTHQLLSRPVIRRMACGTSFISHHMHFYNYNNKTNDFLHAIDSCHVDSCTHSYVVTTSPEYPPSLTTPLSVRSILPALTSLCMYSMPCRYSKASNVSLHITDISSSWRAHLCTCSSSTRRLLITVCNVTMPVQVCMEMLYSNNGHWCHVYR